MSAEYVPDDLLHDQDLDDLPCDECGGVDGEHEDDCDTGANLVADEDQDGYEEEEND